MLESAIQHVGDDFHVAVRVHGEPAAAGHAVIVHDAQRAEMHVLRVVVIGKGKGEMGVQPAVIGVTAFVALANVDHGPPPGSREHNTRYNDYCQEVDSTAPLRSSLPLPL